MVFSSLQNVKNTYKYTFESSNMLSKTAFNLFYLSYYLYNYMFKNIFNFIFNPTAIKLVLVNNWKRRISRPKLFLNLNNYIFFSKKWCLFFFNFIIIKKSIVIKELRSRKGKSFKRQKKNLKLNFFSFIVLQKLFLITKNFLC